MLNKMIVYLARAGYGGDAPCASKTDSHQANYITASIAMIHLSIRVLGGNIDFATLGGIEVCNALKRFGQCMKIIEWEQAYRL